MLSFQVFDANRSQINEHQSRYLKIMHEADAKIKERPTSEAGWVIQKESTCGLATILPLNFVCTIFNVGLLISFIFVNPIIPIALLIINNLGTQIANCILASPNINLNDEQEVSYLRFYMGSNTLLDLINQRGIRPIIGYDLLQKIRPHSMAKEEFYGRFRVLAIAMETVTEQHVQVNRLISQEIDKRKTKDNSVEMDRTKAYWLDTHERVYKEAVSVLEDAFSALKANRDLEDLDSTATTLSIRYSGAPPIKLPSAPIEEA